MQHFEAVAPSRQASGHPARAAVLLATMVLAAVALVAMSSSGDRAEPVSFPLYSCAFRQLSFGSLLVSSAARLDPVCRHAGWS